MIGEKEIATSKVAPRAPYVTIKGLIIIICSEAQLVFLTASQATPG